MPAVCLANVSPNSPRILCWITVINPTRVLARRGICWRCWRRRFNGRAPVRGAVPNTVGRGPVPRRARDNRVFAMTGSSRYDNRTIARDRPSRYGNRGVLDTVERSRGTGPRATVKRGRFGFVERSRGTGPRATVREAVPNTVGRGPVPRHARDNRAFAMTGSSRCDDRTIARDRPSRYGETGRFGFVERSRGTGPRATIIGAVLDTVDGKIKFFSKKP